MATPASADLRAQLRVLVGQPPKGIQQHHLADTLRHAQAQHATWCGVTGHQFAQAIHLAQHPPALFVDPQSAGGGFERLGIAVQQCHSEGLLQALHPPGDRRLGQAQALGGLAQGSVADHRDEGVDVIDFHGASTNCISRILA